MKYLCKVHYVASLFWGGGICSHIYEYVDCKYSLYFFVFKLFHFVHLHVSLYFCHTLYRVNVVRCKNPRFMDRMASV